MPYLGFLACSIAIPTEKLAGSYYTDHLFVHMLYTYSPFDQSVRIWAMNLSLRPLLPEIIKRDRGPLVGSESPPKRQQGPHGQACEACRTFKTKVRKSKSTQHSNFLQQLTDHRSVRVNVQLARNASNVKRLADMSRRSRVERGRSTTISARTDPRMKS
jgi:hypothetical protein